MTVIDRQETNISGMFRQHAALLMAPSKTPTEDELVSVAEG